MSQKPESLDELRARFGHLRDRMNPAARDENAQQNMPLVKRDKPQDISQDVQNNEPEFLEGQTSKPDFEKAAANNKTEIRENVSQGSEMVEKDKASPKPKPPSNGQDVNWAAHNERMGKDDAKSREAEKLAHYRELLKQAKEREQYSPDQSQDRDFGQDYSR